MGGKNGYGVKLVNIFSKQKASPVFVELTVSIVPREHDACVHNRTVLLYTGSAMDVPADVVTTVSTIGTVLVFLMLCAQLPAVATVVRKRTTGNLSVLPTLGQISNFVTWTVYGYFKGDPNIIRVNLIGMGFGAFYITIFGLFTPKSGQRTLWRLFGTLFLVTAAIECFLVFLVKDPELRLNLMGSVSIACNVAMFSAPIASVRLALSTMNPAALPLLLVFVNTITGLTWMTYGVLVSNYFVAGPNMAGTVLNTMQLAAGVYIAVAAARNPTIIKPLPGAGKDDDEALLSGEDGAYDSVEVGANA